MHVTEGDEALVDVIDKGEASAPPVLFVHGAWHGAWCWDEHFLDLFADNGYRAVALNLPAHGGRDAAKALHRHTVTDYVAAVADAAARLPSHPVVIGHSMGGYVTQKYLETHDAPAAVLVASMPHTGVAPFLFRWWKQHPLLFGRSLGNTQRLLGTPALVRQKFFGPHTPEETVVACTARLQNESLAVLPGAVSRLPKPNLVSTPLLVLGAEHDDCFTVDEVRATARAYGTEAVIFPGMGHDMMLEPGWRDVADHITSWLRERGLSPTEQ